MSISFSCCGLACCGRDQKVLDARIRQENIGLVYDKIARIYDVWGLLTDRLKKHGFKVEVREYYQQMLFPSEVILAYKGPC